jgi:hemerythrin-like domain-containing protein
MSTSPISLHPTPSAGFDEPFEMLAECHGQVERMLVLLGRLEAHLLAHGADGQAARAACDVMRYFDEAAPRHHEDEERHVFPRLAAAGHSGLVDRLLAQHAEMASAWARARVPLEAVAHGRWSEGEVGPAREAWADFAGLYRRHVRDEDDHAFPAASSMTAPEERRIMGEEMAARRGVGSVRGLDARQSDNPVAHQNAFDGHEGAGKARGG